jgi:formate--tetrahydrofolate ligase
VEVALSEVFTKGGQGGIEMAQKLCDLIDRQPSGFKVLYDLDMPIKDKIKLINKEIYGGKDVAFTDKALKEIRAIEELGLSNLPICMAKTQYSLTDDPSLLGRPEGFTLNVKEVRISAGAGFIVALTGDIMTMPGLPKIPSANNIDIDARGKITGLF